MAAGQFPHRFIRPGSGWWGRRHTLDELSSLIDLGCIRAAGWDGCFLIYANVAVRPGPEFEQAWPLPYCRELLDPYFDLAGHTLEVTPVQPDPRAGRLPTKTLAVPQAAERLVTSRP